MSDMQWNNKFTEILRRDHATAWGNWTLDSSIEVGSYGYLDARTGSFIRVGKLENIIIGENSSYQQVEYKDSGITKTQSDVQFSGEYLDPTTGTTVKSGIEVSWSFSNQNSISCAATIGAVQYLENMTEVMQDCFPILLKAAKSCGYATDDGLGIRQGFGVVTNAVIASGCTNLASKDANSSFSLIGSIEGVNAMTGSGQVKAGIKGSYKEQKEVKAIESRLWPATQDTVEDAGVVLSFDFTSFNGETMLPGWTKPITQVIVNFEKYGSYIAYCYVNYFSTLTKKSVQQTVTAVGTMTRQIDIGLDAKDVVINVDFACGDSYVFRTYNPIVEWNNGYANVKLNGWWPFGSSADFTH